MRSYWVSSAVGDAGGEGHIGRAGQRRSPIRIGIVDDHPVFRLGLKRALERESDIDITWELGSVSGLDTVMGKTPVDVILMDIYMGAGGDGMAATRHVLEKWPEVRVAVISASVDARVGPASKRAGAHAFIPKAMPVSEMVSTIRRLAAATPAHTANGTRPGRTSGLKGLSPRQRQVLEQIRVGRTNREIAARLGISIATVNKHVHEVLTVLNVRNRTQAAAAIEKEVGD